MSKTVENCGLIGLGRMGGRLALRLQEQGFAVTAYDIDQSERTELLASGIRIVDSLEAIISDISSPRLIMTILPAGDITEATIAQLSKLLQPGDAIFELSNSNYQHTMSRSKLLSARKIEFLDIGISGGVTGARNGPMLTVGASPEQYRKWEAVLTKIAVDSGVVHAGPNGWGHLVKTVHNGIEYGLLQAIAEGLHIIKAKADASGEEINLKDICRAWSHGSIIESRLLHDAIEGLEILEQNNVAGSVGGGETGRWAQELAHELNIKTPALEAALNFRQESQNNPSLTGAIIAAIRNVFGEHPFNKK